MKLAHMALVRPAIRMVMVHVAPHDWPVEGMCRGSHARRGRAPCGPTSASFHFRHSFFPSYIFLPSYMYVSVREKGESRCFAIRNLTENHPAEGGKSVDSGLRQMVPFSILVGGAGWGSSSPPCEAANGCSYVGHYGYLHDPTLVRLQNCHLASWGATPFVFRGPTSLVWWIECLE